MRCLLSAIAVLAALGCGSTDAEVSRIAAGVQQELRRGQVAAAQALVDEGISLTQSAPDSAPAWRIRLLRAEVRIARLEMTEAAADLEAPIPAGATFDGLRARQQYLLALMQVTRGQLQPGLKTIEGATALVKDDPDLRLDLEGLGIQARFRLGQWDEAETRLRAVMAEATERADVYREAQATNNLGMSRLIRNRFDDALPQFERVLSFKDLEQTRIYGLALNNQGICLARLGQFEKALAAQRRAVEIHERSGRKTDLMQALGEMGTTYLLQDDLTQAVPYLQRALAIATEAGVGADGSLWARNLAAAFVALGQWDDAAKYNEEARRLNPPNRAGKLVFNTATSAQIAAARGDAAQAARLFEEVLANSSSEPRVQWVAHEGLANLAVAARRPADAAKHFEAALATVEKTRSAVLKTDYRLSFLTRLIYFHRAYVEFLLANGQSDRALEVADSSRGRVLAERLGVAAPSRGTAAAFRQRARESGQVLVFYWLAPRGSRAWVISGSGIRSFALAAQTEIEPLVEQYHAQVQNTVVDPLATADNAGDRLYAKLVTPLASAIPRDAKLVIVPDGALHRLNFETLPVRTGGAARYWIDDVTIQVAPSLAMLTATAAQKSTTRQLLLVGNPTPRAPDFPALSYAAAEMDGVSKTFGDGSVTVLQSEHASPAAFRGAKPEQYSRIHFTSHAVANPESPMDSAVILSGPDSAFKLYARDVAEMPLAADLVTVSACRSAGDRAYSGEGLVGFAWAFLRAGSRRVVAGLWDVDDRSTAALMSTFYARLAAGDSAPAALRTAKLALLHERAMRPYYWAPLQMFTASP